MTATFISVIIGALFYWRFILLARAAIHFPFYTRESLCGTPRGKIDRSFQRDAKREINYEGKMYVSREMDDKSRLRLRRQILTQFSI